MKILNGAFDDIKEECLYCKKRVNYNIFCSENCRKLYFQERKEAHINTYISKRNKKEKRKIEKLADILNPEQIADMINDIENSINKKLKEK